jgi:sugar lactone lactonase YvrE/protein required for attachment to host cells
MNRACIAIIDGIHARVYTCQDDSHHDPRAVCDLVNHSPADVFARSVVAELDRIAREDACDRVVVVASPRMLGELHQVDRILHRDDLELDEIPRDLAKPPSRPHGWQVAAMLAGSLVLALIGCTSSGSNSGGGNDGSSAPGFTNGTSTLAGGSEAGYVDGPRANVLFNNPVNVAYGPDGKVYVADFDNGKLRAIESDGTTSTVIAQSGFATPFGLAFVRGTLYVETDADPMGHHSTGSMTGTIWRVDLGAKSATPVVQSLGRPRGLVALSDGRLAASDYEHHVVQVIDPGSGEVTTLAGTWNAAGYADGAGAAARFAMPYGMAQRSDGSLVVCDAGNNRLRVVTLSGQVTTLAGTGTAGFADGAMASAQVDRPEGIAIAANGDLYIADTGNYRVRKISGTTMTTIAGDGTAGYLDADDPMQSEMYGLEGLAVRPDASLIYVADGTRGDPVPFNRVRQIKPAD